MAANIFASRSAEPSGVPEIRDASTSRLEPWKEGQFWLVLVFAGCIFLSRSSALTIRGEESRRIRVGVEMLESGDWIVPREQGRVFADRPPLASWLIAVAIAVTGDQGPAVVRFPSALASILLTSLIYAYCRGFLSRTGAFCGAVAYASCAQVMEIGRLAENEATMALLVGGSLLVWHLGYVRRWHPGLIWTLGYALAALATLTKGLQGPVYFAGGVGVFLALQRDWRMLFSRWHALGLCAFTSIVLTWQVPFASMVSGDEMRRTWSEQAAMRYDVRRFGAFFSHLVSYPFEVLACLLPWSLLLVVFARRGFRASLGTARGHVSFLLTALAVAFPSVWLATDARTRYFMPLYPCIAPLIGLVVERSLKTAQCPEARQNWRWFLAGAGFLVPLMGVGIALVTWDPWDRLAAFAQPTWFAASFVFVALASGIGLMRLRSAHTPWATQASAAVVATTVAFVFVGVVTTALARRSEDTAAAVAAVKARLPDDVQLVSFGLAHHVFAYHFQDSIQLRPWPTEGDEDRLEYFCFHQFGGTVPDLPFAWERIGEVSVDRNHHPVPHERMVIGRRTSGPTPRLAERTSR